jgi:predicted nucleic acid-binding protein
MTVLDTNILVRVLTDDDPDQVEAARRLLASDDIALLDCVAGPVCLDC